MRPSVSIALPVLLALAVGCRQAPEPASPFATEIDAAIGRGAAFLLESQADDGAWRSDVYGAFKRGDALTPLALRALITLPPSPEIRRAIERGSAYLAALAPGRNTSARPPQFAVYTAAQAVEVLSASTVRGHRAARGAWVADLERRQLTANLGWSEDEVHYGGWGYSMAVPRKPPPGAFQPPLLEANTSATLFALQALRAAGAAPGDPACRQALIFLERMQNYADPPVGRRRRRLPFHRQRSGAQQGRRRRHRRGWPGPLHLLRQHHG